MRSPQGDVFEVVPLLDADVITTNLFLHHLDEGKLARLLALAAAKARGFVACEPRRSSAALLASHLVFALAAIR